MLIEIEIPDNNNDTSIPMTCEGCRWLFFETDFYCRLFSIDKPLELSHKNDVMPCNECFKLRTKNQMTYEIDNLQWTKTFDEMTWQEAMNFCKNLNYGGYDDWRLPTRKELFSLVDDEKYNPACKIDECKSKAYWSSTTYADYTSFAWRVYFYYGNVNYGDKSDSYYVRAVRSL